ncbi:phage tail tape measure protein [Roseicyclus sp. F158]|uniref:Phage tail tape measure protein n=1 Tax=Tropicimonas omnivorans TaxID=3075590 RepID=A0ABU3DIR9_9RHOB|nr:phage tail tape measure protein [Roseicyclus sp. F158]MDT0683620.1 phage tail tape measure protein [Roseicyclus sp. F158]
MGTEETDAIRAEMEALEDQLDDAGTMAAVFGAELERMQGSLSAATGSVGALGGGIDRGLRRAFKDLTLDGARLSDTLRGVAQSIAGATYTAAMKPVTKTLGGVVAQQLARIGSAAPFANGGAFSAGRVMPFAKGGVVTSPTTFAMRGGRGLMGEAGPEAIMPLTRGADGRFGVSAGGGGRPVNVVVNVRTPDVAGFQRSQGQIAAQMGRALARGQRNR